ncbi:UvrD-helicase domain-containing protein [Micromonospora sp. WMMD998]|uniref:UvrD-helicase domain-containing protein n=1 Tax=Micromonospora sp. WMMD998 TaxID=3016092 RepID=UPI00249C7A31|nr:UvrD-helicase domain-containing protein [Micromonospora sp. WMMD998]WFE41489.1 AAA family ATPase [Micromonospora sp. WMMD998]
MFDHRFTPIFNDCVQRYQSRPEVLAALSQALTELAVKPFGNPRLQTHAVRKAQPDTFTSYVTNKGHRLIWRRVGNVIVLLLFGEHDAVYRRAERLRLEIDDTQNVLRVIDEDPETGRDVPYAKRRAEEGRLFMAWNDGELSAFGFAPHEIRVLRHLNEDADLISLDRHMRHDAWQMAMNLAMYARPDGEPTSPALEEEPALAGQPTISEDDRLSEALRSTRTSPEFVPVPADRLADWLARPIEDWMVYLDPAQQDLVDRSYSGPARIRGGAGTGKTVVALHRARALARLGRKVLVTTYVRNLPEVYQQIFARFAPVERDAVEFANVHRWALQFLRRQGVPIRVDPREAEKGWRAAYNRVVDANSVLRKGGFSTTYLWEEVDWVIRGRALPDLGAYLALERNGRGTRLSSDLRADVWRLATEYANELAQRGVADFTDVLLRAHEVAKNAPSEYDAVIVDEAQDLTDAALRLIYALVGDRPNGLLLVGDGQQSIYPGGFNLASVGIRVRGRSHVLTHNYRNTRQVYEVAQAVVDGHPFDDGGDRPEPGLRAVEVSRTGAPPVFSANRSHEDHDLALAAAIESAVEEGTGIGDLAVLVPTRALARHYTDFIDSLGFPAQRLEDYEGSPTTLVKVGTYQRAKGLEFKRAFLPRLDPEGLSERPARGEDADAHAERIALVRRQLFVAMTRARDGLWLGWVGEPSALLPMS